MANELRTKRLLERKSIKEINNIGHRLCWVREKLGLTKKEVALATGIPESSYHGREQGVRTDYAEEYLVLSIFFDGIWQKKYRPGHKPAFEGSQVDSISPMWLQFGKDAQLKDAKALIDELRAKFKEVEADQLYREMELKRQLSLFELEVG